MLRHFGFLFRIDRRIYLSLGIVLLLSIILLLVQYFRRVDCESAKFLVSGDMSIDKVVEFYDNTPNAKSWEWDFGDGSAPDYRQRTLHQYKKEGNYIIRLKINGHCVHEKSIHITTTSLDTDALGQSVSYHFKSAGQKKVTLIVNGDVEHRAVKTIYVAPKTIKAKQKIDLKSYEFERSHASFSLPKGNPQKDPLVDMLDNIPVSPRGNTKKDTLAEPKKAPEISNEQFQLLLNQVANQSKTKEDFKDYLCGNYDIPVVINDNKILPFDESKISMSITKLENGEFG